MPDRPVVIDASVGVPLVHDEANSLAVSRLVHEARRAKRRLLVPPLFWLEVLNTLGRRYRLGPDILLQAVADLDTAGVGTVPLDRPTLLLTLDAVVRHGLTAYDAAYLALAQAADAELFTADAELAAAAGAAGVPVRAVGLGAAGGRIGESSAPYAVDRAASWADWPGAAAYLADLRARLSPPA
jgi:predicted nucleic acid-binding protein